MGKNFNDFFDDVIVNAKAAASVVSQKAEEAYDNSKLKINAAEIRSDINEKLKSLGALAYKSAVHNADVEEQMKKTIEEITDLKNTLSTLNESMSASKKQKKCAECGATVAKDSAFCSSCGAKIDGGEDDDFANI